MQCKNCGADFSPEIDDLSPFIHLNPHKMGFCDKQCWKKYDDAHDVVEERPVFIGAAVDMIANNQRRKKENLCHAEDFSGSVISRMERDKTMKKMIKDGSGWKDKGLRAAAMAMQREQENNRKAQTKARDYKELHEMKKKYGLLPEQLRNR